MQAVTRNSESSFIGLINNKINSGEVLGTLLQRDANHLRISRGVLRTST